MSNIDELEKILLEAGETITKEDEKFSTDTYAIAARVKNLARSSDASLTPMGESLCNIYVHILKSFYDCAETLPEPYKKTLIDLVKSKEGMCRDVIKLNRKK